MENSLDWSLSADNSVRNISPHSENLSGADGDNLPAYFDFELTLQYDVPLLGAGMKVILVGPSSTNVSLRSLEALSSEIF
jgi:hypothetical protein